MRVMSVVAVGLACLMLAGCAQLDQLLNPQATTAGGSRVAPKLQNLPKPDPARVKTVTVYKFKNKSGFLHGLTMAHGMTDQLITGLVKSGHFKVVERATLQDIQTEKRLQQSGQATGAAGQTKLLGAQLIFAGAVTEMDQTGGGRVGVGRAGVRVGISMRTGTVALDMRVIDAGTGQVIDSLDVRRSVRKTGVSAAHRWGVSGSVQVSNALDLAIRECLDEAVYQLVTKHGAF